MRVAIQIAVALFASLTWTAPTASREFRIDWEHTEPYIEIVRDGKYTNSNGTEIQFAAIRFHLGHVKLRLLDTRETIDSGRVVDSGISRSTVDGRSYAEILNYGLEGVLQRQSRETIALAPAGWSRSQRFLEHVGLLRVGGRQIHPLSDRSGLSAILCLNDASGFSGYDAFVPVLFFANDPSSLNRRALTCQDAVQAGPRILEERGRAGISASERESVKYKRVVFAVDDPGRNEFPSKSREAARNGYLIATRNPTSLYDIQEMLLDSNFYHGPKPHWAVSLAGANLTGMIIVTDKGTEFIENTQAVVGSVLAVDRRN